MRFKTTLLSLAALFAANTALAMPITGAISWEGDFSRSGDVFTFSGVEINEATGDFAAAGFTHNEPLQVANLDIGSFAPLVLWSAHGIPFTLNRIAVRFDSKPATVVFGGATVSGAGFDDTPMRLVFSTSLSNFSATAVPEPGVSVLLLSGLAGLVALRRRRTAFN